MNTRENFRQLIENEFHRRKQVDAAYSLRVFAKDINLEHSFLAKILKGSRSVTALTVRRLGPRLGLSPEQTNLMLEELLQKKIGHEKVSKSKSWLNVLPAKNFDAISEWYYPAILTLMAVPSFSSKPQWVARELGITEFEAANALAQLEQKNYFYRDAQGRCIVSQKQNSVLPNRETTANLKRYQKQTLLKAMTAVEAVELEARDHASITVATSAKKIAQAKLQIRAFRRKLMRFLEEVESPDTVYCFTTALFPLSQPNKKGQSK